MTRSTTSSSAEANQPADFAIVIGINDYPYMEGGSLENAHDDARAFSNWLVRKAGVPEKNVKLILSAVNDKYPSPEQSQIDRAFEEVFDAARALQGGRGRRLYVYFAGHGSSCEQRHVALLTARCSKKNPNFSLNTTEYHDGLSRRALFPEQVLFYDCCRKYDSRFIGRGPDWYTKEPEPGAEDVQQWIYYAAGFNQSANARKMIYSNRRGLFTRALLDGLEGDAVDPTMPGGPITLRSLGQYVRHRLEQLAEKERVSRQVLCWNTAGRFGDGDLVLLPSENPVLFSVSVCAGAPAVNVIIWSGQYVKVREVPLQSGHAAVDLPMGEYVFEAHPVPSDSKSGKRICGVGPNGPKLITL